MISDHTSEANNGKHELINTIDDVFIEIRT